MCRLPACSATVENDVENYRKPHYCIFFRNRTDVGWCTARVSHSSIRARSANVTRGRDSHLSTRNCPLCGQDTPKGHRYCHDCDTDGSYTSSSSASSSARRSPPPARRGSNVPLILLFFVVSAFGTVTVGFFAPDALSIPLVGEKATEAREWGELRTVRVNSNIRSQATTSSKIMGKLAAGDSVRVEAVPNGWYRVYDSRLVPRIEAKPLGFVYGRLLDPASIQVADRGDGTDGS